MKLTVTKKHIVGALTTIKGAVQAKPSLPILAHVCLRASARALELTGTDLELFARAEIAAEVEKQGELTVSAKLLYQIASALPGNDETVLHLEAIQTKGNTSLRLTCGEAKYHLGILPAEDFPATPSLQSSPADSVGKLELAQPTLRRLLQLTSYPSQTADEGRHVLCGTFLTTTGKNFTTVATDGRRLAHLTHTVEYDLPATATIIPCRTVAALLPLLAEDIKPVGITTCDRFIQFAFCNKADDTEITFVSRVIDGNYPNWRQVIPNTDTAASVLSVGRADLLATLKRVALVQENVRFEFDRQLLTLTARDANANATECLLIPACKAGVFTLNSLYLIQALEAATDDQVNIFYADGMAAIVMTPNGPAPLPWQAVIMPLRTEAATKPDETNPAPAAKPAKSGKGKPAAAPKEDNDDGDDQAAADEEPATATQVPA